MSSGAKPKGVKKTVQYVPSRYMQAAEKVSQSHLSREKSLFLKTCSDGRGLQISGNSSQDTSGSGTSKLSTSQDKRGLTSTPNKGEFPLPQLDASAVTDVRGCISVPHLKEKIGPISAHSLRRNFAKKYKPQDEVPQAYASIIVSHKDKKKNDTYNEKLIDAELDLLYAVYLQSALLESEAKRTLKSRSANAVEILHKLFNLVLQHLSKVKSKECYLKISSSLIEVHNHCQKQESVLKPIFEIIPTMEEQYKSLAEAINATKHKLYVKNIVLPETGSEVEILEILQMMSEFITGFFEILPNYNCIISSSNVLKSYADAGEILTIALQRGLNLLVDTRELYFSEASLTLGCGKL